jgi:multidrug efflux pump subunit AcrA (membrane-fusion protein)
MRFAMGSFALSVVLATAGCGKKEEAVGPAPVPVKVETVATQEIRPTWRYSGEIRPDMQVQLAFKQAGYVASLHQVRGADGRLRNVQVGDEVPGATVLARLRRCDYEASLSMATGQEKSMQGALQASQAELEQAKADQTKTDLDFQRAEALYAAKAMTRPDYDAAVAHHTAATAKVQAAIRQIEARQGQLEAAQAQSASARISLDDTNLTTPMPSVIVSKAVEPGSLVAGGTTGFTIADTRVVKVEFGVPDGMLSHFRMGSPVAVEVEALQGRVLTGQITEIAASANRESRVFNIQVSLPNRDRSLKVGMIASVRVEQAGDSQRIPLVPVTALITSQSGSSNYSVFTVREENGKQIAQLRSVRIGETIGRSVAINQGLTPGERIIVNRTNQLSDGSLVDVED